MGSAAENKAIVHAFLMQHLSVNDSLIIEFGCGKGENLEFIKNKINPNVLGVEIHPPYIKEAKQRGLKIIEEDICDMDILLISYAIDEFYYSIPLINNNIPPKENVVFVLLDVIEHLPLDKAVELICNMKALSSKILIYAPIGYCPQQPYDNNEYQKHLSTWAEHMFQDLDFNYCIKYNFHEGLPNDWSNDVIFAYWHKRY